MELGQFLTNPVGKFSKEIGARYVLKGNIRDNVDRILKSPLSKHLTLTVYRKDATTFCIYGRIPSLSKDIIYDVLIDLDMSETQAVLNAKCKFFSNSPSWIYTYAFVYYHNDMVIDECKKFVPKLCKTKKPEKTNPTLSIGFEYSLHIISYLIDSQFKTYDDLDTACLSTKEWKTFFADTSKFISFKKKEKQAATADKIPIRQNIKREDAQQDARIAAAAARTVTKRSKSITTTSVIRKIKSVKKI